uniref:Kinesin-like protein n=1 Tax=Alexandrium monilatum TaxID=311494 RepID=A0A7S4PTU8_9DINO
MVASNIKVFIRIRPSVKPSKAFKAVPEEGLVNFELEKHTPEGQVNNTKTNYKFKFDGILGMKITQEDVFNAVAKPVIEDVLQGINGTIFAYGQTGSGKTFTVTGGSERYADRGLIPRTIAYLFDAFKQRSDATYRLYVSYLEIYNDDGYDLLSREDTAQKLEDLPKVMLRQDDEGNIHLRNLSVNMAQKAEDALNLLFLGDTNRAVAETPMNDASTRSHCMFILWVDSTKPDSDTVRRAKLHLVDLAGSERISKTGVEGSLQKEARYINLSLFYLEQVIVALHAKSQGKAHHVPYRNSMMTSVLRDSLGGNCKTVMVGAMAVEDRNIDESISTCTFAQRVACIKNNATVNEELDSALLIKRLKKEVAELKDELKLLSSDGDAEEDLTEEDLEECKKLVSSYLAESDPQAPFVCGSASRFRECFRILRGIYWQREHDGFPTSGGAAASSASPAVASPNGSGADLAMSGLEAKVQKLRQEVATRDEEIGMLVKSLGKRSQAAQAAAKDGRVFIRGPRAGDAAGSQAAAAVGAPAASASTAPAAAASAAPAAATGPAPAAASPAAPEPAAPAPAAAEAWGAGAEPLQNSAALLLDRNRAFEVFRKSVRRAEVAEESRSTGVKLVEEANALGERANAARAAIAQKQKHIEKLRMERLMGSSPRDPEAEAALRAGGAPADSPEVLALLKEIDEHKAVWHQCTGRLKQVKAELDSYRRTLELNKQRLQRDFEAWYAALQASSGAEAGLQPLAAPPGAGGAAVPAAGAGASKPRISSCSSQVSEADSSARPSPALGSQTPAPALPRARATPEEQPVRAWGASPTSPHSSPVSEVSSTRASSRGGVTRAPSSAASSAASTIASGGAPAAAAPTPTSVRAPAPPPAAATPVQAAPAAAVPRRTGHAQTDLEIEAFYAAMADLR